MRLSRARPGQGCGGACITLFSPVSARMKWKAARAHTHTHTHTIHHLSPPPPRSLRSVYFNFFTSLALSCRRRDPLLSRACSHLTWKRNAGADSTATARLAIVATWRRERRTALMEDMIITCPFTFWCVRCRCVASADDSLGQATQRAHPPPKPSQSISIQEEIKAGKST